MEAFRGPQSYTKQQSQFYPDISSGLFHMATFISSFTWSKLAKTRGASGRGNWNSTYIDDSNHYDNGDHSNDNVEGERSNLPWLGWGHIRSKATWSGTHVSGGQLVPDQGRNEGGVVNVMMVIYLPDSIIIIIPDPQAQDLYRHHPNPYHPYPPSYQACLKAVLRFSSLFAKSSTIAL